MSARKVAARFEANVARTRALLAAGKITPAEAVAATRRAMADALQGTLRGRA